MTLQHPERLSQGHILTKRRTPARSAATSAFAVPVVLHREDLGWRTPAIVGEASQVHDDLRALGGARQRFSVKNVFAVGKVEAAHDVAISFQSRRNDCRSNAAPVTGDQYPHFCTQNARFQVVAAAYAPEAAHAKPGLASITCRSSLRVAPRSQQHKGAGVIGRLGVQLERRHRFHGLVLVRRMGVRADALAIFVEAERGRHRMSVLVAPGETPLTRTCGANSWRAGARRRARHACWQCT